MTETGIARAWSIRRGDGVTLGFTDHDQLLEFAGIRFRPDLGLTARALVQATGLSVDNTEAAGALSAEAITERDILAGKWDAASVRMWEVEWANVAQRRLIFRGSLGDVTRAGGAFRAELRALSEALNAPEGRIYHPRCTADLGDDLCKVALTSAGLSTEVAVQGLTDGRIFSFTAFPAHDANWFENGQLLVVDGEAEGLRGSIKNDTAREGARREVELWAALPILPQAGDRVRLIAGCDKSAKTCRLKFRNLLNFRGFPHLPSEDWLLAPQAGRRNG